MITAKAYLRRRLRLVTLTTAIAVATAAVATVAAAQDSATTRGTTTRGAATRQADPADRVLDRMLRDNATRDAGQDRELDRDPSGRQFDRSTGTGDQAVAPDTRAQRLLPEGSFVVDRPGRVVESGAGALEFVFDADGQGQAAGDPPMLLLPNLNLQALEKAWNADQDRRFRITGRVTEYRGRNHLVLEKVVVLR